MMMRNVGSGSGCGLGERKARPKSSPACPIKIWQNMLQRNGVTEKSRDGRSVARASRFWRTPREAPFAKKGSELQWGSEIKVDGRMGERIGKGSDPPSDRRCRCKGAYTRAAVGRGDYHSPGTPMESCTRPRRRSLGRRTETAQTDHQSSAPTHAETGSKLISTIRKFWLVRQSQATRLRLLYHEYTSGPTWQRS